MIRFKRYLGELKEDVPANNVGGGNIAGTMVDPAYYPPKKKEKKKKDLLRRKEPVI